MKYFLCLTLLLTTTLAFAQIPKTKNHSLTDTTWHEGAIIKKDGTKVSGTVRYNDALGLVNFDDANEEQLIYGSTRLAGFEYFDKSVNRWRYFLSIENYSERKKEVAWDFHELIMEFENFTVWSKMEPVYLKKDKQFITQVDNPMPETPMFTPIENLTRTEIIYLMDPNSNKFFPILKLETKEDKKNLPGDPSTDKRGTIDFDILEQLFGAQKFRELKTYAKENDLNWRRKADLLVILEEAAR